MGYHPIRALIYTMPTWDLSPGRPDPPGWKGLLVAWPAEVRQRDAWKEKDDEYRRSGQDLRRFDKDDPLL